MTTQNLISATLADDTKNDILQKLTDIRSKLDFLITLDTAQVRSLFKAANGYAPFIEKAYAVSSAHPDILPAVLNVGEFQKDFALIQALTPIQIQVNEQCRKPARHPARGQQRRPGAVAGDLRRRQAARRQGPGRVFFVGGDEIRYCSNKH